MAVVQWSNRPLVTIEKLFGPAYVYWNDQQASQVFAWGDTVEIQVKFQWDDPYGGWVSFLVWIEKFDVSSQSWVTVVNRDHTYYGNENHTTRSVTKNYRLDLGSHNLLVFRVKVSSTVGRAAEYLDENHPNYYRQFTAYVQHFGDFSLDYVPMTILYGPPGQDMVNALTQSSEYGTILSFGFTEEVGTKHGDTMSVKGGVHAQFGYVSVSGGGSAGQGVENSDILEDAMTNKLMLSYEWSTTLIADNQRVIGRSYWGPLSDLFLLLKNPWFSLIGDENGDLSLTASELTAVETEILIVPAHKLLRPGDDPVALHIPEETRRRLLELDPFFVNLHLFFPEDEADPSVPLSAAVDPFRDPTGGNMFDVSSNHRASLIARYSISNGVELDLSQVEGIKISDQYTSASTYISEVSKFSEGFIGIGAFADMVTLGLSQSHFTGRFTRTSYHSSRELVLGDVKTALCKLVRNQNQADLEDIEVYWDKQFSTFMFRKIRPGSGSMGGIIFDIRGYGIVQTGATLVLIEQAIQKYPWSFLPVFYALGLEFDEPVIDYEPLITVILEGAFDLAGLTAQLPSHLLNQTTTNNQGRYAFRNLTPGTYVLQAGDTKQRVVVTKDDVVSGKRKHVDVTGVRRLLNLRSSALWELQEALGVSLPPARRIQLALRQARDIDESTFKTILKAEGLKLADLEKRASVRYGEERVQAGVGAVGGWVLDHEGKGLAQTEVVLLGSAALRRVSARFTHLWPRVNLERIITAMPSRDVYSTRTDSRGRYVVRNLPAGTYQVGAGNKLSSIRLTRKETSTGTFKRKDFSSVEPMLNLKKASALELKHALRTTMATAIRLQETLKKTRSLTEAKFRNILERESLSIDMLASRFHVAYR